MPLLGPIMPRHHRPIALLAPLALLTLLGGCQLMGGEPAEAVAARKEAEGKAFGGACRHAGRAIEDCFGLNKRAEKAALFAGWREMNDYMRENKIDEVAPQHGAGTQMAAKPATEGTEPKAETPVKPAKAGKHES